MIGSGVARLITLIAHALVIGGSKIGQKRHGLKSMTSTERSEPAQLLSDRKERGVHLMTV